MIELEGSRWQELVRSCVGRTYNISESVYSGFERRNRSEVAVVLPFLVFEDGFLLILRVLGLELRIHELRSRRDKPFVGHLIASFPDDDSVIGIHELPDSQTVERLEVGDYFLWIFQIPEIERSAQIVRPFLFFGFFDTLVSVVVEVGLFEEESGVTGPDILGWDLVVHGDIIVEISPSDLLEMERGIVPELVESESFREDVEFVLLVDSFLFQPYSIER